MKRRKAFATRNYALAKRVCLTNREAPMTEKQFYVLLHSGVLRTDAEIKSYDKWEENGCPE